MRIQLKGNLETLAPKKAKIYPLSPRDRAVIDEVHDKLQAQGRLSWTTGNTLFSAPCFVVWRYREGKEPKGRPVIDIRELNKCAVSDLLPVPLQEEIIVASEAAQKSPYLTDWLGSITGSFTQTIATCSP